MRYELPFSCYLSADGETRKIEGDWKSMAMIQAEGKKRMIFLLGYYLTKVLVMPLGWEKI